jgi:hypothetical protein
MPRLSETPYLHDGAIVVGSTLGRYVEIGAQARITESIFGDYSYTDRYADIAYSTLGKFANIAAFVRINPANIPISAPRCIISCIARNITGRTRKAKTRSSTGGARVAPSSAMTPGSAMDR